MDTKELRLFLGKRVVESKMTKDSKIQMLKFVKEAEEYQLMALALDGKIVTLDEQAQDIVKDRFVASTILKK